MTSQDNASVEDHTPSAALPERSDDLLACALGRDLQGATLRFALYLLAVSAVVATITALVY